MNKATNCNYNHYFKNHLTNDYGIPKDKNEENTQLNNEESTQLNTIKTNRSENIQLNTIKTDRTESMQLNNLTAEKIIIITRSIYLKLLYNLVNNENNEINKIIDFLKDKVKSSTTSNNKINDPKNFQLMIDNQNIKEYITKYLNLNNKDFKKEFLKAQYEILEIILNDHLNSEYTIDLQDNNKSLTSEIKQIVRTNPSILKCYLKIIDKTPTLIKYMIKINNWIYSIFNCRLFILEPLLDDTNKLINNIEYILKNYPDNLNNPINLYKHTITIENDKKSIIRNGHIHSLDAAKIYLNEMIQTSEFTDENNHKIIIDNRLMYDVRFRESKLISNHLKFINQAIEDYNNNNTTKVKILNFNLQPQYLFGIHTKNIKKLNEFNQLLINSGKHEELSNSDYKYKFMYKMLTYVLKNPNQFISTGGKNGYHLGFILQYLATSIGIGFSEGCKSNKDRGSAKKLHDEIFYAKLNLLDSRSLEEIGYKDFFKNIKNDKNKNIYQDIYNNNTSNLITFLNTNFPGNKNLSGIEDMLKAIEVDKKDMIGFSEYAKS